MLEHCLQNTTGSPGGGDKYKRRKILCFIRLVNTLLVLVFAGTYFCLMKLPNFLCLCFHGFAMKMLDFPSEFSKLPENH